MERPNQKIKIEVQPQSSEEYSKDDDLNKTQEEIENLLNESQTIIKKSSDKKSSKAAIASASTTETLSKQRKKIADLVIEAIKYGGSKSVSFPSIKKYLGEKYDVDRLFYIKKSMKQLLEDDIIYNKTKGSGCNGSFSIRAQPVKKAKSTQKGAKKVASKANKPQEKDDVKEKVASRKGAVGSKQTDEK